MSHPVNVSLNYGNQYTYQVRGYTANNTTVAVTDLKVWEEISTSATATSHKADGLTSGTTYTFSLRAVNSTGNGLDATVNSTAMAVPSKPATFTATAKDASVDLAWTYSNPNDDYVSGWQFRQWTGSNADFVVSDGGRQELTLSWTASSTANITKWEYSADGSIWTGICWTAVNSGCPSVTSHTFSTGGLSALPSGTHTIQVRAAVSSGTAPTVSNLEAWEVISTSATTTSYTATGLDNDTEYSFMVRAVNPAGNGADSDAKKATPYPSPAKPAGFTATAKNASVDLSWDDPSDSTITSWEYAYKTGSTYGSWTTIPSSSATTTSYTVPSLTNNTAHTFKIRAVNGAGDGAASDEASATPIPAPAAPTGFAATAKTGKTPVILYTQGQVDLSWDGSEQQQHRQVAIPVQVEAGRRQLRQLHRLDGHPLQFREHHVLHRNQAHPGHGVHLQAAGGERDRERRGVRVGGGQARAAHAGQADGVQRHVQDSFGEAYVDESQQLHHHGLEVPAAFEQRLGQLEGHTPQPQEHYVLHRNRPHQR